ncbi:MAG: hypothetical protein WBA57_13055 [Elainellaceae cyanobacterium]
MKRFQRREDGRFKAKSTEDRKVRSIRATDSAWESLGDLAEAQNMSRADLVERLIERGELDFIQGLEIVQTIAKTLSINSDGVLPQDLAHAINPEQELQPLQELAVRLKPIQDLMAYVNNVQSLVDKLEPLQQLAQHLKPMTNLAEKLEPIQQLAQQLEPLSQLEQLQDLGEQVDIIQTAARRVEGVRRQSGSGSDMENSAQTLPGGSDDLEGGDEQQTLAIALQVIDQFLEARSLETCLPVAQACSVSNSQPRNLSLPSNAELAQNIRLSEFRQWMTKKLQSS